MITHLWVEAPQWANSREPQRVEVVRETKTTFVVRTPTSTGWRQWRVNKQWACYTRAEVLQAELKHAQQFLEKLEENRKRWDAQVNWLKSELSKEAEQGMVSAGNTGEARNDPQSKP